VQNIAKDLKNRQFKRVYLLYGEEAYLKRTYKNRLRDAVLEGGDTVNLNTYEGKAADPKEMISVAETLPFFAEYRCLLVENSGFLKHTNEEKAAYIKQIPEYAVLIFVEDEVDKRGKLFKQVKDHGYAAEMTRQSDGKLVTWILGRLKMEGKKITEQTMKQFLSRTGNDMDYISNELDKLIAYTMHRDVITEADVEAVCPAQIQGKIFDMVGAIGDRNTKRALALYSDLLALHEPPMRILFLISRQFHLLLRVKELTKQGCGSDVIADQTGLQRFLIGKYTAQASRSEKAFLAEALQACVEVEEAVKTGRLEDQLGVELLIGKYGR
jgi:DNA polymerase-3 subunit delta